MSAANSTETAEVKPIGTPFRKGQSGNPSGRPKGIARTVRELTNAEERVRALIEIADDPDQRAADRIRATELLLAYGYGKPAANPYDGADVLEADALTQEALDVMSKLRAELQNRAA